MILLSDGNTKEIPVDPDDWPRCAKCRMPVEEFKVVDTGDSYTFVAMCHGQVESATIPDDVWDTAVGTHVNFGLAFQGEQNEQRTTLDV